MRKGPRKLVGISLALAFVFAAAGTAFPQDGTGRSGSVERPAPGRKRKAPHRAAARASAVSHPEAVRRVELGKLALSVNEGASRIEISQVGVPPGPADVIPVPSRTASLIVRTLPAGNYRVSVTKPGFEAESREIQIGDGKRHRLAIYLKPSMAFLTVGASVADARIEIEKVGSFNTSVQRLLLKPGNYRLRVSRRGYAPQTLTVDLKTSGREENVQVVLKPLRVDELLEDANVSLAEGNFAAARELAGDVLKLNAAHARANLLYGMVEMRHGGQDATSYFLKAIRNGEKYRVPVKVQDPRGSGLLNAELSVERDRITITSPGRVDLELTILKSNVSALNLFPDQGFIVLAGNSDFHGRTVQPNLRIHPHDVVAGMPSGTTRCTSANCARDLARLARLLSEWRTGEAGRK